MVKTFPVQPTVKHFLFLEYGILIFCSSVFIEMNAKVSLRDTKYNCNI